AGFASLFLSSDASRWTGAQLPDGTAVQRAMDVTAQMTSSNRRAFWESLATVLTETKLRAPTTLATSSF
ncbi:MAG: hypothetical protein ACXVZX_06160, partial [Terriglobales bacterium]